jgi:hypothetical protein
MESTSPSNSLIGYTRRIGAAAHWSDPNLFWSKTGFDRREEINRLLDYQLRLLETSRAVEPTRKQKKKQKK